MREEIINGKREVLRTTISGKDHPDLVKLSARVSELGRHMNHFPVIVDVDPPLK